MKRLLLALLAQVFFFIWAWPQAPTAEENSLLWEISGKELQQASYLFGTIHLIQKEDYALSDLAKNALEKAKWVTFEINMAEMSDFSKLMPLMMKAFMADGKTLRSLLSEEDYTLVKAHFEKAGLPMFLIERIKPMFLSAMGNEDVASMQSNGEMVSYEMELMKIAEEQKKQVAGLETAEYQMSIFDSIPYEVQAKMLVESIKAGEGDNHAFQEMVELYKKQDITGLSKMIQADQEVSNYEEVLLVRRNKNWIPVMAKMMAESPTFFAVGAGHLAGEQGVIALLRAAGYNVKPLR